MDNRNRLTRNDEWQVGARYRYLKGQKGERERRRLPAMEVTFLGWAENRARVGTAEFLHPNGSKSIAFSGVWRGRYVLIAPPQKLPVE